MTTHTSVAGLDARAAVIVMQAVKNVSRNGRTVMVTIHQPSIEIFETFDACVLLQAGGRVMNLPSPHPTTQILFTCLLCWMLRGGKGISARALPSKIQRISSPVFHTAVMQCVTVIFYDQFISLLQILRAMCRR